jgi:hypothetical protein
MRKQSISSLLVAFGAIFYASQSFADIKWDYASPSCSGTATCTASAGGINAIASGWADTANASGSASAGSGYLQDAYIYSYGTSGLGIKNRDAYTNPVQDTGESGPPEHSVDNNGRYDSLLIRFDQAIKLTKVQLGWWQADSDITVLRYAGQNAPTLAGQTYAGLLSLGWQLVGHYADVGNLSQKTAAVNAGGFSASYWLIGAYNPLGGSTQYSTGNDYLKLASLSGTPSNQVPAPAPIALLLAAGLAWGAVRKAGLARA